MKKNKKIDPGRLAELKKKREELKRQEEQMRMQMLADLGALLVESVTKNDLGQLDFSPEKKMRYYRLQPRSRTLFKQDFFFLNHQIGRLLPRHGHRPGKGQKAFFDSRTDAPRWSFSPKFFPFQPQNSSQKVVAFCPVSFASLHRLGDKKHSFWPQSGCGAGRGYGSIFQRKIGLHPALSSKKNKLQLRRIISLLVALSHRLK